MPNKRSNRSKVQHFYCPLCESRLWRINTPKYYIFYRNAREIKQNTPLSAKKAAFFATQHTTYLDTKKWIEGFYCEEHGNLWLLVSRKNPQCLDYRLAKEEDWLNTNKTFDPRIGNPSVSEFSQRMSRKVRYR